MKIQTGLILPDVHRSVVQEGFWKALLKLQADVKPDFTDILGDFEDFQSASRHVEDFDRPAHEKSLGWVRKGLNELYAHGAKRIIYQEGNHEDGIARFLTSQAPSFRSIASLPNWLATHFPKVEWVSQTKVLSIGKLDLLHGHQFMGGGFSHAVSKYHSRTAVELYGRPGHLVMYGHTHRPSSFEASNHWGTMRAVGLGCVRTIPPDVKWLKGRPAGWANEAALVFTGPTFVEHHILRYLNGHVVFQGKVY